VPKARESLRSLLNVGIQLDIYTQATVAYEGKPNSLTEAFVYFKHFVMITLLPTLYENVI
jgi:hypothetical protein